MLAHELRRRTAAVRVAGEAIAMLRSQGLDTVPMLELLLAEVADLDQLAGELLGDPRSELTEAVPEPAQPDVAATVQAAARTVAVARGATVRVQAGVQAEIEASPTMLRQAIENLIDNAAAHGGADGVEVDVRADPAAGQVEVVVADRGAAADVPSGHGIGLFVVRRFLDEAGGRSWVAPREGGGTLVGLRLPLRPDAEPDPLDIA
ncbi:MAG TPA: HAMP domain-containing sensor histidine kinase, partial [Actinomycetota bacterium]|nr:HAMP domain-containing sensor histidine kinase [Actinomycetota bacterium]